MLQRRRRAGQGESWPCHQANRNRTAFGADCANPATISGALHPEPAGGSTGPQERIIVSSILNRETAFSACDHRGIEGGHPAARSWRPLGRRRSRVGAAVAALDDVRRRPQATGLDVAGDGNRQPVLAPLRWQPRARLPLMAFGMLALLGALAGGLVALGRLWAYLAPLATGLGAFGLAMGWPGGVWLLTLGSVVMTIVFAAIVTRQPALFTIVMAAGTLCWLTGQV